MRVSNILFFTTFIHSFFVLLKGILVDPKSLDIVDLYSEEAAVGGLKGVQLLRELLEAEIVVLLLLALLEHQDLCFTDVQGWR